MITKDARRTLVLFHPMTICKIIWNPKAVRHLGLSLRAAQTNVVFALVALWKRSRIEKKEVKKTQTQQNTHTRQCVSRQMRLIFCGTTTVLYCAVHRNFSFIYARIHPMLM